MKSINGIPRNSVILMPPPKENEQNAPTTVITAPNWIVAFLRDHPF